MNLKALRQDLAHILANCHSSMIKHPVLEQVWLQVFAVPSGTAYREVYWRGGGKDLEAQKTLQAVRRFRDLPTQEGAVRQIIYQS